MGKTWECHDIINTSVELTVWTFKVIRDRTEDHSLHLGVHIQKDPDGACKMQVYSPFWMINRTGEDLQYKVGTNSLL